MSRIRSLSLLAAILVAALLPIDALAVPGWSGPTRVLAVLEPSNAPSVVADAQGALHVAYFADGHRGGVPGGVWYATNESGTWAAERVTTDDDFYARPSLALDAAGNAFIAFARVHCFSCAPFDASRIYLATNKSGTWVVRKRTDGYADLAPSLRIRDGSIHIAFQRKTPTAGHPGIWYLTNESGAWMSRRIASNEGRCVSDQFPSIAVSSTGIVSVAFERAPATTTGCAGFSAGIRLASESGAGWAQQSITSDLDDYGPSVVLDAADRPHLAFGRAGEGAFYTRRVGGSWIAPQLAGLGEDPRLAVDAASKAHVAFEKSGAVYATNASGEWVRTRLSAGGLDEGTSGGPGIALSASGKPRVLWARSEAASEDDLGIWLASKL